MLINKAIPPSAGPRPSQDRVRQCSSAPLLDHLRNRVIDHLRSWPLSPPTHRSACPSGRDHGGSGCGTTTYGTPRMRGPSNVRTPWHWQCGRRTP
jgi:hypothetical protein